MHNLVFPSSSYENFQEQKTFFLPWKIDWLIDLIDWVDQYYGIGLIYA